MTAKPRELDLRSPAPAGQDAAAARTTASGKIRTKPSSAPPQGPPRPSAPELKVYRPPASGSVPDADAAPAKLRKRHSLTNLAVLTDAEKKMHLYRRSPPRWDDDAARPGPGETGARPGAGGGKTPLSRTLSKSEQSLFQGKPKPLSSPAGTPGSGKPSRIPAPGKPRGPYAEVKPISQAPEGSGKGADPSDPPHKPPVSNGTHGSTGINGKKPAGEKGRAEGPVTEEEKKKEAKETEGEDDKTFLKVDPELVVTVLGDLEQLLFSQILDPESQRKRTVQNVLDLRHNLEETMTSLRGAQLSHSCLDVGTCYDSDEAAAFSVSSLSNRSSPLSWRQGQASPRLQAGDAPSADHARSRSPVRVGHTSRIQLIEELDADPAYLKGGYLGDGDLGRKRPEDDDDDMDDIDDDDMDDMDDLDELGNGRRFHGYTPR